MTLALADIAPAHPRGAARGVRPALARFGLPALGIACAGAAWAGLGALLASDPGFAAFAGLAPVPALEALAEMVVDGDALRAARPSLERLLGGLAAAILLGAPLGLLMGLSRGFERAAALPCQFLRMVSPLAWMPVAVLAFPDWDSAIMFLVAAAALWPVLFATAAGVKRLDPAWPLVARSFGAGWGALLRRVFVPAVAQDLLTGIRLALGTAWIVLVPAEYLGVTSGLGYAINDARDTLSYDRLAALVLLIGALGFAMDAALQAVIARVRWTNAG
jgi:NitT/TauT family transport system permease protein